MLTVNRVPLSITSMQDVDLFREWDGATISLTVYNDRQADWDDVDDYVHMGYTVMSVTEV